MERSNTPRIIEETTAIAAAAKARGRALQQSPFAIMSAKYDAAHDCFKFTLRDETVLVLPRPSLEVRRILRARSEDLRRIEIDELRTHVWFPDIDEGLNPVGLMARRFNTVLQAERGKNGGRARSAAKAKASKANGKKGGRPRSAGQATH